MTGKQRKPAAFRIEDEKDPAPAKEPKVKKTGSKARQPAAVVAEIEWADNDPFVAERTSTLGNSPLEEALTPPVAKARSRRFSFAKIGLNAFGLLISLAFALWIDTLVTGLFERSALLGWAATVLAAICVAAFLGLALREIAGIMRLEAVHAIKSAADEARSERNPAKARAVESRLVRLFSNRPETARARRQLKELEGDIIDGPQLMALAEAELLGPLDEQARQLIVGSAKRVSVVTAISPRALLDVGYVLFEAMRLIRNLATLYGGRPGTIGSVRLARDVIAHLAVTGSMAVGDGVIQQLMGHGLASKLSARLGEGVINGLMTARIGIAAMDLCRPMGFHNLKRPGIGDFVGELTRQATGTRKPENKR
ncbi:MAG: TIGR01620 family protein [Pseudomonadota bacterium]